MNIEFSVVGTQSSCAGDEHTLCARIRAEFDEMPGLNLTLLQAARLFDVEPARCERVLARSRRQRRAVERRPSV